MIAVQGRKPLSYHFLAPLSFPCAVHLGLCLIAAVCLIATLVHIQRSIRCLPREITLRHSTPKNPVKVPATTHALRIIGGQWRGRKLSFPAIEGLRPTGDRIRETLFNWLAPDIQGARCLDVFAGSGALGLEALSRGASVGLLCERNPQAANQLRAHVERLHAVNAEVKQGDSLAYLHLGNPDTPYDVVFIDPPFALDLWQATIDALEAGQWLADTACIYIEADQAAAYAVPAHWQLHRDKRAGHVNYRLFYRTPRPD